MKLMDAWWIHQIRKWEKNDRMYKVTKMQMRQPPLIDRLLFESSRRLYVKPICGGAWKLAELLARKNLSAPVRKQANDSLMKLIKEKRTDDIAALVHGFKIQVGSREEHHWRTDDSRYLDYTEIVPVFENKIYSCENWGNAVIEGINALIPIRDWSRTHIPRLLERTDLSDAVMIEVMKACGKVDWRIDAIAKLLEQKNLSAPVIKQANDLLLEWITDYEKRGETKEIANLVKGVASWHMEYSDSDDTLNGYFTEGNKGFRSVKDSGEMQLLISCTNWNQAVIEQLAALVPIKEWHSDQIANLLKRTDLTPQMRKEAEEALHPANPKAT